MRKTVAKRIKRQAYEDGKSGDIPHPPAGGLTAQFRKYRKWFVRGWMASNVRGRAPIR